MLTVYGIPNCDTIKKTLDTLKGYNAEFIFHDYRKEGISRDKLEEWLLQAPLETILNKKSTTYKELTDEQKRDTESIETAIPIMMAKPTIIKRPIIEDQKILSIGLNKDKLNELFSKG